jgi:hypothetical protein
MQFIAPAAGVGNIFTARALTATKLLRCKANATKKMDKTYSEYIMQPRK